jgi:pyruvate ferredoxin oxidoreductase gamma subunit
MRQVIIAGRGGQGVMASAEALAQALWKQGSHVQAFPAFEPEKKGAPTTAYVRYDAHDILLHCEIDAADELIVLEPAVLTSLNIQPRLTANALLVINGSPSSLPPGYTEKYRIWFINAAQIAVNRKLGTRLMPQVGFLVLGAYARAIGSEAFLKAVQSVVAGMGADAESETVMAVREAFDRTIAGGS